MKVVLVYDRINKFGGAERILLALHEIFPSAPLYTAVYDEKKAPWAKIFSQINPSFLQKFPLAKSHHELYPYLMPLAFETFDFANFDIVISVTSEAAKGIITRPPTVHISYILTPTRYIWSGEKDYLQNPGFGPIDPLLKLLLPTLFAKLRPIDYILAHRPDKLIAISNNVMNRIKKYYHRDADVLYPPIDTDFFRPKLRKIRTNYFLLVSRLVPYKRVDVAIQAFNRLKYKLVIIGTGSEKDRLKKLANKNIQFVGSLTDEKLLGYYQDCIALIFTSDEDLGLVPIEAQSCGKPVVALKGGGALETVIEGNTGEFYDKQVPDSLTKTINRFLKKSYSPDDCRNNALRFNKERFKKEFSIMIKKIKI
ncbi:glycosyltransferase [Candidatus Gottesmanbacteria bacterium]|nr:glycosyltransferase [Candidatus Gottesmanbacteria bacterium]